MMYGLQDQKLMNLCQYTPMQERTILDRKVSPLLTRIRTCDSDANIIVSKNHNASPPKDPSTVSQLYNTIYDSVQTPLLERAAMETAGKSPIKEAITPMREAQQSFKFKSKKISPLRAEHFSAEFGNKDIGWGVNNPALAQPFHKVKCLPTKDMPHKIYWDHDKTRFYMYTTGFFSSHVDAKMNLSFDEMEGLSLREQKQLIQQRSVEMNKKFNLKNKFQNNKSFKSARHEISNDLHTKSAFN